jgi:hypothetical protein
VYTGFWWGNLSESDHLEGTDGDGSIILKWIIRTWDGRGAMDWNNLAENMDRCRALVNGIMNLRVP